MIETNKNTGVIIVEPETGSTIHGISSLVEFENLTEIGDNRPYKPVADPQSGPGGDKMDCVTDSANGCLETCLNKLIVLKLLPQDYINFFYENGYMIDGTMTKNAEGFIDGGQIALSCRWAAIQDGTTHEGNSAVAVGNWYENNGAIPLSMLPDNQTLTWDEYYDKKCITKEMIIMSNRFYEMFAVAYKWIGYDDNSITQALRQGAVQELTPTCPGWNTDDPIKACGDPVCHATEILFVEPNGIKDIWDSYNPYNKQLDHDYPIPYRMCYAMSVKI